MEAVGAGGDGFSGLEIIKSAHPDVVIMDMIMPQGWMGWEYLNN